MPCHAMDYVFVLLHVLCCTIHARMKLMLACYSPDCSSLEITANVFVVLALFKKCASLQILFLTQAQVKTG